MNISETYSHLNGLEFLLVHKPNLWKEIQAVIAAVDANKCRTKVSKEKTMKGKLLFSPIDMNSVHSAPTSPTRWRRLRRR